MHELRIVDDPHAALQWRINGFVLEWRYFALDWTGDWHAELSTMGLPKTLERRALWRDLFLHPCVADA